MSQSKIQSSGTESLPKSNPTSNGILKFVNEKNSYHRPQGKKCNPYRQFGISSDAPIQFSSKSTLISNMYKFKQFNANSNHKPEFFSQKNFITISHGKRPADKEENNFVKQYNKAVQQNKIAFHHKTSKISNFYDKNAWMGSRFFVMGHQRSEKALDANKNQIEFHTRSARSLNLSKKRQMTPTTTFRGSQYPTHESMKQLILSQKSKIRSMRNSLANYYKPEQEPDQKRPQTSFQYYTATTKRQILDDGKRKMENLVRKPKQFEINLPQWGEKQFNLKFIEWEPEKSKVKTEKQKQMSLERTNNTQTLRKSKYQQQH